MRFGCLTVFRLTALPCFFLPLLCSPQSFSVLVGRFLGSQAIGFFNCCVLPLQPINN